MKKIFIFLFAIPFLLSTNQEVFGEFIKDNLSFRVSGGPFIPYEGNRGFGIQVGAGYTALPNLVIGAELAYRQFETTFLEVRGVRVEAFSLNLLAQYLFFPKGVSPYVAGGYRFSVNVIDTKKIERQRPGIDVFDKVGVGSGLFGLVGFLFPMNPHVSFFSELRASIDIQLTHFEGTKVENLGGGSVLGGVVFHFY